MVGEIIRDHSEYFRSGACGSIKLNAPREIQRQREKFTAETQRKATASRTQARAESSALGVVANAVEQADDGEHCAPPYAGVQIVEDYFDHRRVGNLIEAREENQHAIDQQRYAYEEPD